MTVPSTNYKAGPFVCDGVQTEFPFEFPVLDKKHVAVWKDGAPVVVGYTITLAGNGGGTVIFETAPAKGSRVAIIRDVPLTQTTDIQNNTAFLPEVLETEYDKGVMIDQMLAEVLSRCLKVSPTDDPFDIEAILALLRGATLVSIGESLKAFLAYSSGELKVADSVPKKGIYVPVLVDGVVQLYEVADLPREAAVYE